jgi:hypothetical protein
MFTQENTTGYTDEELAEFNRLLADQLAGLDPEDEEYQQIRRTFADRVARAS